MRTVNISKAKAHLSRLIEGIAKGEPFIIAKARKLVAKVTAIDARTCPESNRLGFMPGQMTVPEDFDTMARARNRSQPRRGAIANDG